jgi:hypothetical protein
MPAGGWAHPLSTDGWLTRHALQQGKMRLHGLIGPGRAVTLHCKKRSTEPVNFFAARCHIRDRRPVYRMGLPHRLD